VAHGHNVLYLHNDQVLGLASSVLCEIVPYAPQILALEYPRSGDYPHDRILLKLDRVAPVHGVETTALWRIRAPGSRRQPPHLVLLAENQSRTHGSETKHYLLFTNYASAGIHKLIGWVAYVGTRSIELAGA
jgi:hypothetical protein